MTGMVWIGLRTFRLHCALNVASCQPPPLSALEDGLEHHEGCQLCQAVNKLPICGALDNGELALTVGDPEPVPQSQETLCPVSDLLVHPQTVRALVVFKCSGMQMHSIQSIVTCLTHHFFDQPTQWEKHLEGCRWGRAFCLKGGLKEMWLWLALSDNGPSTKEEDVSSPRSHTIVISVIFPTKQSTEICIHMQIQAALVLGGIHNQTLATCLSETSQDSFDHAGV